MPAPEVPYLLVELQYEQCWPDVHSHVPYHLCGMQ